MEPESNICKKSEPEPESVLFLAVTGVCMVFTNVIASVQNKHYRITVASMVGGDWTGVGFSNVKKIWTQVRIQKLSNRSGVGVWKCDSGHLCCLVGYSAWFAVGLSSLLCNCLIGACCVTSWITIDQADSENFDVWSAVSQPPSETYNAIYDTMQFLSFLAAGKSGYGL